MIMCVGVVFGVLFTRSRGSSAGVPFRGIPILMSMEALAAKGPVTVPEYGYDDVMEVAE